jgi:hypothetical protein
MTRFLVSALLSSALCFSALPMFAATAAPDATYKLVLNQDDLPAVSLGSSSILTFQANAEPSHGTTVFGLPQNMGPIDRILRGVVALGLIGTGVYGLSSNAISAPVSWTLIGVAAIPTATAATGYCPLYQLFGLDYSF